MKTFVFTLSFWSTWQLALSFPYQGTPFKALDKRANNNSSSCRCFPGDTCWPSTEVWNELNRTLAGRLIPTIPIASVCHDSSFGPYDADACASVQSTWDWPQTHYETSSSPMAPFFANLSCDPFTPRDAQCAIGSYVQYAVNVSSADHIRIALGFAQRYNIRLVIRNTGHDYLSKSTGAGALAIWTHHLNNVSVQDYASPTYSGKAIKIGAGVMNIDGQAAAHSHGLTIVAGDCQSVGIAGGYTQGGGHGPLASKYGLGADQALEWEVITASGECLRATPTESQDMYWALSGGGGGTYGVVLSLTVKAYPIVPASTANLTFYSQGVSSEAFYNVVQTFLTTLPGITDAGATCIWLLTENSLALSPVSAPDLTSQQLQALLQPTLDALTQSGVSYGTWNELIP
jgi:hypothetical protein